MAVLTALADPVRLTYVRALAAAGGGAWCGQVLKETDLTISKSTLSHHLKILRDAGLTRTRVEGTRRYVSLRERDMEQRFPGLLTTILQA